MSRTAIDLLRNKPIFKHDGVIRSALYGKKVLVTGCMGSIGSNLFGTLFQYGADVHGVDWNEDAVARYLSDDGLSWVSVGDFAESQVEGWDYIFHCAAYKHVKLGEMNKEGYFLNNSQRTYSLVSRVYTKNPMCKVVMASTDKVAGASYMGKTKAVAEQHLDRYGYSSVRLVNVIGSRGSVIDLWNRGVYMICNRKVERYWMTSSDASYAMILCAFMPHGIYSVHKAPKFSMGAMAKAYEILNRKKIKWKEYRMGPTEALSEGLVQPGEKLVHQNSILARVVRENN